MSSPGFTLLLLPLAALAAWWRRPFAGRDAGGSTATDSGTADDRPLLGRVGGLIAEGIAVTDATGAVTESNPAFRRLFGIETEASGLDLSRLTGQKELELLVFDTLSSGGSRQLEIDQTTHSGDGRAVSRHLIVSCVAFEDHSGAVLSARDITDSMLLGQLRRDLVANVSHEIKTPLTAIRGFAETLRDGALAEPDTAMRFTDRILQQCDRLQALLVDLLTLSRLERSAAPVERQPVSMAELVREATETLQPAAAERGVDLATHLDSVSTIEGDPEALSELCLNLIDNAIKYNQDGGRVDARLRQRDGEIVLEIADTGRGIPEAALSRIFERFYRVDRGRSRKEGGTGLGLAIAKHAAELHGGRIAVESAVGRGSTFRVFLPVASPD